MMLIYARMKVENFVRNPFVMDKIYDIELDHQIWKASVSIKHMDHSIYMRECKVESLKNKKENILNKLKIINFSSHALHNLLTKSVLFLSLV